MDRWVFIVKSKIVLKMKTIIFLAVTLLSFPLFAQYNPEKLNAVKIGSSYGGFTGLEFNIGYERAISPKQIIYGSLFRTNRLSRGFTFGYKYNLLSYKWIEAFAGLDLRSEYFNYRPVGIERKSFSFSIQPTLELRFNVNKTHFITTGLHFYPFYIDKNVGGDNFLHKINIGVSRRF